MSAPPEQRLVLGALPGPGRLVALAGAGIQHLVNVSGLDLAEIYGDAALARFQCTTHCFPDVFSEGEPLTNPRHPPVVGPGAYLARTHPSERRALLDAIEAVHAALAEGGTVFLFCAQGRGRSPLVAAAALRRVDSRPLPTILGLVRHLQPAAHFTDLSLSALAWSQTARAVASPRGRP